jgi:Tol biopolymer transport system component
MIRRFSICIWCLIGLSLATLPVQAADPPRLGLYVLDVETGKATQLATEPLPEHAYCGSPDWTGDAKRVVFDATPGKEFSKTHIVATDFPGTEPRKLIDLGAGNCPTWSPDAKQVVFRLNPGALANAEPGIWIMNSDGTARRRLADGDLPKCSRDGKTILSVSFSNPCALTLIDARSGDSQPIELADHQFFSVPSWAGDGQTLVAVVRGKGAASIALIDVSDPTKARLKEVIWTRGTGVSDEPIYPVYAADAKRCVFVGRSPQGFFLYRIDADTKGVPLKLEPNSHGERIAGLAITRDGKRVLFCSEREAKKGPNEQPGETE